ncbi:hypothetical protein QMZ92_11295 [Streptomyces sp. HNM0645]|uniref:hypothetical protein n=1 Tax=Streptomyces sp. HNM0645 TaxID=2782343 RepID=UPI0024B701E5|nr:hypothetical protein [Streptomyces sp. HNM0645]MDI9884960.1 hypothetical protein [Streptomyces sp. HNM0645]
MAAQDYDSQLLESVSVRRRRLQDALVFGVQRHRRSLDERLGKVFAGVVIAAVLCAGCAGWSFISHRLIGQGPYEPSVQPRACPGGLPCRGVQLERPQSREGRAWRGRTSGRPTSGSR